jgi:hypothetical protein
LTLGIKNKVKARKGIRTHHVLILYPDTLKKNDINPARKLTININPLQPMI